MSSTEDMLANFPADIFAGASDFVEPVSEGSDSVETPADIPAVDVPAAPADTAAITDPLDAAPPAGVNPPDAQAAPADAETLDEGTIKTKDAKGRYKYQLDENRYKTVYGNHQLAQQATDLIGEPLTLDSITLRNDAYLAQERLFDHITSGEPDRQADVLNFMIQEMKTAQADGETGVDPTIPFAQTVYATLRDQAPDAYAHLRMQSARDLLGEMYEAASDAKDSALFGSAQRFALKLAGIGPKPANMTDAQYADHISEITGRSEIPWHTMQEMAGLTRGEEPLTAAQRRIQELETQLNGRQTTGATEQYAQWDRSHAKTVNAAVFTDAVTPALTSVADAWKAFPDDYARLVVNPLNSEVSNIVRGDQVLQQQVHDLRARARRATSEGVRTQIGEQIKQLYVNRATLAADKAKGPILKFAAEALKGRSAQTNERRTAAQTHSAPGGTGSPVRQSVLPPEVGSFKNGVYDPGTAMKQAMAAMASLNAGR